MKRRQRAIPALFGSSASLDEYILSLAPLGYWKLDETSGTAAVNYGSLGSAANGTYNGATLAQIDAPGGGRAPLFGGDGDRVNLYSAALSAAFPKTAGSLVVWWKVYGAGNWADGVRRKMISLAAPTGNEWVTFEKTATADQLKFEYKAGSTLTTLASTAYANLGWNMMALTWTDAGDELKWFNNGFQTGATQTGIGTWIATALHTDYTVIGNNRNGTTEFPWHGYLCRVQLFNSVLLPAQVLRQVVLSA